MSNPEYEKGFTPYHLLPADKKAEREEKTKLLNDILLLAGYNGTPVNVDDYHQLPKMMAYFMKQTFGSAGEICAKLLGWEDAPSDNVIHLRHVIQELGNVLDGKHDPIDQINKLIDSGRLVFDNPAEQNAFLTRMKEEAEQGLFDKKFFDVSKKLVTLANDYGGTGVELAYKIPETDTSFIDYGTPVEITAQNLAHFGLMRDMPLYGINDQGVASSLHLELDPSDIPDGATFSLVKDQEGSVICAFIEYPGEEGRGFYLMPDIQDSSGQPGFSPANMGPAVLGPLNTGFRDPSTLTQIDPLAPTPQTPIPLLPAGTGGPAPAANSPRPGSTMGTVGGAAPATVPTPQPSVSGQ